MCVCVCVCVMNFRFYEYTFLVKVIVKKYFMRIDSLSWVTIVFPSVKESSLGEEILSLKSRLFVQGSNRK